MLYILSGPECPSTPYPRCPELSMVLATTKNKHNYVWNGLSPCTWGPHTAKSGVRTTRKKEFGMEWSTVVYRGTNKLQPGVNGQHNADITASGIMAMAQQLGLLIKTTTARTPSGDMIAGDPMSDSSGLSVGCMDVLYVTEFEPLLLAPQVRALVLESLGVNAVDPGLTSQMRWNVKHGDTITWRVSIMDAATHEHTVILTEDCAYRVLSREH